MSNETKQWTVVSHGQRKSLCRSGSTRSSETNDDDDDQHHTTTDQQQYMTEIVNMYRYMEMFGHSPNFTPHDSLVRLTAPDASCRNLPLGLAALETVQPIRKFGAHNVFFSKT